MNLKRLLVLALLLVHRGEAVERRGDLHVEALLTGERQGFLEQDTGPFPIAERAHRPPVRGQYAAELGGETRLPEQGHRLGAELRGTLVVALPERHVSGSVERSAAERTRGVRGVR